MNSKIIIILSLLLFSLTNSINAQDKKVMKIAKDFYWEMSHRLPWHNGLCKNIQSTFVFKAISLLDILLLLYLAAITFAIIVILSIISFVLIKLVFIFKYKSVFDLAEDVGLEPTRPESRQFSKLGPYQLGLIFQCTKKPKFPQAG